MIEGKRTVNTKQNHEDIVEKLILEGTIENENKEKYYRPNQIAMPDTKLKNT